MKMLARQYVWWPVINKKIARDQCQIVYTLSGEPQGSSTGTTSPLGMASEALG